jgi:hypothetical protein
VARMGRGAPDHQGIRRRNPLSEGGRRCVV